MTPARRQLVVARYLYRQTFVRRPLNLLLLVGGFALSLFNPLALFGAAVMLGNLPVLAVSYVPPNLPVSRSSVLAWSWLPPAVVLLLSLWASLVMGGQGILPAGVGIGPQPFRAASAEAGRPPRVHVGGSLWQLGGSAPRFVELPGGVRVEAERRRILGLPLYAHNPYTVPVGASSHVAALQLHRALMACCDLKLTLRQVEAHIAHPGPDSTQSLEFAAAQQLRSDRASVFLRQLILALTMLAWTRVILLAQPTASGALHRIVPPWLKVTGAGILLVGGFVLVGVVMGMAAVFSLDALFPIQLTIGVLTRSWERFPWLGAALALALLLWVGRSLARRFERLELPLRQADGRKGGRR